MQEREPHIKPGSAADFTVAALLLLLIGGIVFGLVAFILANGNPKDCRLPWDPPRTRHMAN